MSAPVVCPYTVTVMATVTGMNMSNVTMSTIMSNGIMIMVAAMSM